MKTRSIQTTSVVLCCAITLLPGCSSEFSETVRDESAGVNGSFEIVRSGLPVNWLVYTPSTIPTGSYELIIDSTDFKDGTQSLKFLVTECSSTGGWHSPGIDQEYDAKPGATYKVSFWAKNEGARFRAIVGGVSAWEGQLHTIVDTAESIPDWMQFDYVFEMPSEFDRIRFELNVLQPGSFWVDDFRIEEISNQGA